MNSLKEKPLILRYQEAPKVQNFAIQAPIINTSLTKIHHLLASYCKFSDRTSWITLAMPLSIDASGVLVRFSSNGKRLDRSGWYVLFLYGDFTGAFGCWRTMGQQQITLEQS
ncbi:MAG: hypothetical protein R3E95_06750 [Thiolinea sp.]